MSVLDRLPYIVTRHTKELAHAVCLRCGLRAAAPSENLLERIVENHQCRRVRGETLTKRFVASEQAIQRSRALIDGARTRITATRGSRTRGQGANK